MRTLLKNTLAQSGYNDFTQDGGIGFATTNPKIPLWDEQDLRVLANS